jgi:hypothetical protein
MGSPVLAFDPYGKPASRYRSGVEVDRGWYGACRDHAEPAPVHEGGCAIYDQRDSDIRGGWLSMTTSDPLYPATMLLPAGSPGGVRMLVPDTPGALRPFAATLGVPSRPDSKKQIRR